MTSDQHRLPEVLINTATLTAQPATSEHSGAVWRLEDPERDLDSNVIALPPGGEIQSHTGPDLDVLIHVLAGGGTLSSESTQITLTTGALVWLPRHSQRRFTADDQGLRYLTVHHRKPGLSIDSSRTS